MIEAAMRGFARAFCDALALQEPQRIAPFLHDEVDLIGFGPIDLFPFLGRRHGAADVVALCGDIAATMEFDGFHAESVIVSGNQAAALVRLNATHRFTKRKLSLRIAQFAEFRDGKLISLRAIFDSFDAAEQMLGREIDLSGALG